MGINQVNPSEKLEVSGYIRLEQGKLMIMSPTAEAIQSYGHIKFQSDGALHVFSDMISSHDSKLSLGDTLSSDGYNYNKIAVYEGTTGILKNEYFGGLEMFQYNSGSNLWCCAYGTIHTQICLNCIRGRHHT